MHRSKTLSIRSMWFKIYIEVSNTDKNFLISSSVQQMVYIVIIEWFAEPVSLPLLCWDGDIQHIIYIYIIHFTLELITNIVFIS
jgi:hypothetical protein